MRWKYILAGVSVAVFLTACGTDSSSPNDEVEDSNSEEVSKDNSSNEIVFFEGEVEYFTFDEAVDQADLIAEVEIIEQIREKTDPLPQTFFKANILQDITGEKSGEIIFTQVGIQGEEFNGVSVFEPGEKYVLFLRDNPDYEDVDYFIQGEELGMYKDDGETLVRVVPYEELENIEVATYHNFNSDDSSIEDNLTQSVDKEKLLELVKEKRNE